MATATLAERKKNAKFYVVVGLVVMFAALLAVSVPAAVFVAGLAIFLHGGSEIQATLRETPQSEAGLKP